MPAKTYQKNLFKQGPLHKFRFEILDKMSSIGLKNGDILYRTSDARGPLGLPFSKLVCSLTKSKYSHAAVVLILDSGEIEVLEINDQGTLRYRFIDWLDTAITPNMAIYRLKDIDDDKEKKLKIEIQRFLDEDPEYDFTFSDPNKFYCTETVIEIYKRALDIQLVEGSYIKDVVSFPMYCTLRLGSLLFSIFKTKLCFDQKLYFPGDDKKGMISSNYTYKVFEMNAI